MASQAANRPNTDELGVKEAFIVAGAISVLLVGLVVLRFACNLFLDVCVLGDMNSARRSISNVVRFICPWYGRRTVPEESAPNVSTESLDIELADQRQVEFLNQVLPSEAVTALDLRVWKKQSQLAEGKSVQQSDTGEGEPENEAGSHSGSHVDSHSGSHASSGSMVCSICLHEFVEGDDAYTAACRHVFHKECIGQWVTNSGNGDCPNCRKEVVSRTVLSQLQQIRRPPP